MTQRGGYGRDERDFHQVVHHLSEPGEWTVRKGRGIWGIVLPFVVGYEPQLPLVFEIFVGNVASTWMQQNAGVIGVVVGVL